MSTIYVGGRSHIERLERHDRIEDAVLACSSALDKGVVPGGGIVLQNIDDSIFGTSIQAASIIKESIYEPHRRINSSFAENHKVDKSVVDPAKVTIAAIENSFSIASLILSGSAIVLNPEQWT
jgi:chaperonin GroEL